MALLDRRPVLVLSQTCDVQTKSFLQAAELRYHEVCNAENFQAAFQRAQNIRDCDRADEEWRVKKFWSKYWGTQNQADPEEAERIVAELQKFESHYPQVLTARPENEIVLRWLKDRNLELNYSNLAQSYEANALEGKVYVSPARIGAGKESEVTGAALLGHHNFHLLIQPQQRVSETDRLSADEFRALHPELEDRRISPLLQRRQQQREATREHFEKADAATSESNATRVVDYGPQRNGVPPQPDKISFRKKIAAMTADEIRRECEIDPGFRAALDALN
jgi:hypothetical protein